MSKDKTLINVVSSALKHISSKVLGNIAPFSS